MSACIVANCNSRRVAGNGMSFFKFPCNEPQRCQQWCDILNLAYDGNAAIAMKNKLVCHKHFLLDQLNVVYTVKNTAVPVLVNHAQENIPPVSVQEHNESVRKLEKALNTKNVEVKEKNDNIRALRQTIKRMQDHVAKRGLTIPTTELIKQHFAESPTIMNIVTIQFQRYGDRANSHYNTTEKTLALTFFYCCGKNGYRTLRKLGLRLPSLPTIKRWICRLKFLPGKCQEILDCLKDKVKDMNETEKDCVLTLDETSVKRWITYNRFTDSFFGFDTSSKDMRAANHALVLMIRGINTSWKFPLSYHFASYSTTSDTLSKILLQTLDDLKDIGVKVRMIVTDQGGTNRGLFKRLGVSCEKPFIIHQNAKIYFMYDTPHLMKSIRNNLYGSDGTDGTDLLVPGFELGTEDLVKWSHIKDFYYKDVGLVMRTCPKLTDDHFELTSSMKMKVKLATQVFSRSTYASMKVMVQNGQLPLPCLVTAEFVKKLDEIFDLLNISDEYNAKHVKSGRNIFENRQMLLSYKMWIERVHKCDGNRGRRGTLPCLSGLALTLNSMYLLINDLKNEGYAYILTRRFQSDCLENYFSLIKLKIGSTMVPTCQQFRYAFRYLFVSYIMKNPEGSNCEQLDDDETLEQNARKLDYLLARGNNNLLNDSSNIIDETENEFESSADEDSNDEDRTSYNNNYFFSFVGDLESDKNSLTACIFAAGRAVKKVIQARKCVVCKNMLEFCSDREFPELDSDEYLQQLKAYDMRVFDRNKELGFGHLLRNDVKSVFKEICSIFSRICKESFNHVGTNVVRNVVRGLRRNSVVERWMNSQDKTCKIHREEILSLFVRTRMYSLVQQKNDELKNRPFVVEDDATMDVEPSVNDV